MNKNEIELVNRPDCYIRANSAYGNRPVTSGRLGSAVGHASGGGGYVARSVKTEHFSLLLIL